MNRKLWLVIVGLTVCGVGTFVAGRHSVTIPTILGPACQYVEANPNTGVVLLPGYTYEVGKDNLIVAMKCSTDITATYKSQVLSNLQDDNAVPTP